MQERRYDLDWLRVFATAILVPYHTGRIFDFIPWYIKHREYSVLVDLILRFIEIWHMPLFFLIAGASLWHFLQRNPLDRLVKDKIRRLFIPFIFGVLVLVPPVSFIAYKSAFPLMDSNFIQYYPKFFTFELKGLDGLKGTFTPLHLWFILYLFIFNLLGKRWFGRLSAGKVGNRLDRWLNATKSRPMGLWLFSLPLMVTRPFMPYPNLIYFFLFFIFGFILMTDEIYRHLLVGVFKPSLWATLILTGLYLLIRSYDIFQTSNPIGLYVFQECLVGFISWLWVLVILNVGQRFLSFSNLVLKYFSQAAYPVFLIHMTFIVPIGFYTSHLDMNLFSRYLLINGYTVISVFITYELIVKRVRPIRFLFGLK